MKVLLVDDQVRVLKATKDLISWDKIGVQEVFTADSAEKAKQILETEHIDIMLADIEMPEESGIELRKWQVERYPQVTCIFLTSHADFHYAQEAIRSGVFDYVLQPASLSDIEKVLIRCIEYRCLNESLQAKSEGYEEMVTQSVTAHIIAMFFQKENFLQMDAWRRDTDTLEEDWLFLPCLVQIGKEMSPERERFMMECFGEAQFEEDGFLFSCGRINESEMGVIFYLKNKPVKLSVLSTKFEAVLNKIALNCHCEVNIYIGQYAKDELPAGIKRVMDFAKERILKKNKIYVIDSLKQSELQVPNGMDWGKWMIRRDTVLVQNQITNLLRYAEREQYLTVEYMKKLIHSFLEACAIACYEEKMDVADLFDHNYSQDRILKSYTSIEELQSCVSACLHRYNLLIMQKNGSESSYSVHERMLDILHYLEENMSRMISRREAAKYVMLNEDYFSRMFKKETGTGYKEYVLKQKMEYAQKLLLQTDLPVTIIASRVGYDNFTNFSQMFKKYTNLTPSAYRKGIRS